MREERFETAAMLRDSLFAIEHIQDHVLALTEEEITIAQGAPRKRIEGYDISHLSGEHSIGVMVVTHLDGKRLTFDSSSYRKFRIRSVVGIDDTKSIAEVVARRLGHPEWPAPDLIVIDGGIGQYNAVKRVAGNAKPIIVACAKGPKRNKIDLHYRGHDFADWTEILGELPRICATMTREAHRFAITHVRLAKRKALLR